MEVDSRQLISLAAPVVVAYLTWSAVSGATSPAVQPEAGSSISTVAAAKRPVVPKLTRDLFSQEGYGVGEGGGPMTAPGASGASDAVHLNGTVVAGKWRMAIIDGTRVFEGQTFRGFQVKTVGRDSVTLVNSEGKTIDLSLDIAAQPALASVSEQKPASSVTHEQQTAEKPNKPATTEHDSKSSAKVPYHSKQHAAAAATAANKEGTP